MDNINFSSFFNLRVVAIEENGHDIYVTMKTESAPASCPLCGNIGKLYKHDNREKKYIDIPLSGKCVTLKIKHQRYRCLTCSQVFWERLDHNSIDEKRSCTKRLITYIQMQSYQRTFNDISEEVGLNDKTIRNIFGDYINWLASKMKISSSSWIGIYDLNLIHPRVCIINVNECRLLDILANRNPTAIASWLDNLVNKDQIKFVTVDMNPSYRHVVKTALPQATIMVESDLLKSIIKQILEKLRNEIRKGLTPKERRRFLNDRKLLFKQREVLTEKEQEKLTFWIKRFPIIGSAYDLKEHFINIWNCTSNEQAYQKFQEWSKEIPPGLNEMFDPLVETVSNWREEIFSNIELSKNSQLHSALENFNQKTRKMERGHSFDVLRAKILFPEEVVGEYLTTIKENIDAIKTEPAYYPGVSIPALIQSLESRN